MQRQTPGKALRDAEICVVVAARFSFLVTPAHMYCRDLCLMQQTYTVIAEQSQAVTGQQYCRVEEAHFVVYVL